MVVELGSYLEAFWRSFGCYPISSFREKFSRLKERKEKLFSTCSFYHNHIVEVGVLHLVCSLCSCCSCCSCLVHAYVIVVFIGMLICMLGMLGRD